MSNSTPINPFKAALRAGRHQYGLWLSLADAYAAEACATCGFDWMLVDGEHGPNDLRSTLSILQAVAPYASHPVVRIPEGQTALIKQVLEIGAQTILVPMVETAEQAAELARAMRYPPQGVRGVGSGLARSSRWNLYGDYAQVANAQVCLLVQVESIDAIAHLPAIAATEGVDGVFIGPADLSASMGYLGQPSHPEVKAVIEKAISTILAAGKAPGILATDEALARHCASLGAQFVAVGVDVSLLTQSARALASRFCGAPSADTKGY